MELFCSFTETKRKNMISFKLAYFDREGVVNICLIENAQCLPLIGSNVIVYVESEQQGAVVSDIVHFYKENKSEIVVYADSKERIQKLKNGVKKISDLDLSVRLYNCLREWYQMGWDFTELPITALSKISISEFFSRRRVGNKVVNELERVLKEHNLPITE